MAEILTDKEIESASGGAFGIKYKKCYIRCPACYNPMEVTRNFQAGVGWFEAGECKCGYKHERYLQEPSKD